MFEAFAGKFYMYYLGQCRNKACSM